MRYLSDHPHSIRPPDQERRRHRRVNVALNGRYMLANRQEYPCRTQNMSPGGVALIAEKQPRLGERVVAQAEIGWLEGNCVWLFDRGFAMTLTGTARRRDKLADELTGFADRDAARSCDGRHLPLRLIPPTVPHSTSTTAPRIREQNAMKHPTSRALHAYWDQLRAGRAAPERGEIDPGAIRNVLGDVMILEVGGPHRYTVRLAGTRICSLLGRELKDHPIVEAFTPNDWPELYSLLDSTVKTASPTIASLVGETEDKRMLGLELLLLPLRHHGRAETRMLCSLAAHTQPYWATLMPLARLRLSSSRFKDPTEKSADTATFGASGRAPNFRVQPPNLRVVEGGRV